MATVNLRKIGRLTSTNNDQFLSAWQFRLTPVLAAVACGIAGYLAWHGLNSTGVAGCGGSQVFDCEHVLNSRWSKLLGLPIGVLAVGNYATMLLAYAVYVGSGNSKWRKWSATAVVQLSFVAGFAALWFIGLQALVLQHFCLWCLAAHACGLLLAALACFAALDRDTTRRSVGFAVPLVAGLVAVACVAVTQTLTAQPPTFTIEEFAVVEDEPSAAEEDDFFLFDDDFDPLAEPTESAPALIDSASHDPIATEAEKVKSVDSQPAVKSSEAPKTDVAQEEDDKEIIRTSRVRFPALLLLARPTLLFSGVVTAGGVEGAESEATDGQSVETKKPVAKIEKPGRKIPILGESVKLNSWQWPIVGKTDAKYIVVELFDYTCPHCRKTTPALEETAKHYGEDFALLALPVPMNSVCNESVTVDHAKHAQACELAKIAIGVWLSAPKEFPAFHHWMMAGDTPPDKEAAMTKAIETVGADSLKKQLASGLPDRYVKNATKVYKRAGAGTIPKLMFPHTALVGKTESVNILKQMIEQHF